MKHTYTTPACSLLVALATILACEGPGPAAGDDDGAPQDGPVVTEDRGDGSFETTVDATDDAAWTYFDFESAAQVTPQVPADDPVWDLGVLRFNIKSNGGTSGKGGAAVARLEGTRFDDVTAPPADGWLTDTATDPGVGGPTMMDITPGYVFDGWFVYDMAEHVLRPTPDLVHVVRTPEGNHFKVEMLGYYDDAGTPGFVSFRWAALDG